MTSTLTLSSSSSLSSCDNNNNNNNNNSKNDNNNSSNHDYRLAYIIFSKNRAFQLHSHLYSLFNNHHTSYHTYKSSSSNNNNNNNNDNDKDNDKNNENKQCIFTVYVLYTYDNHQHQSSYDQLKTLYPHVYFIDESIPPNRQYDNNNNNNKHDKHISSSSSEHNDKEGDNNFSSHPFISHMNYLFSHIPILHYSHILFSVDDLLYYHPIPWYTLLSYLNDPHHHHILSIHLSLRNNISYCHPRQLSQSIPISAKTTNIPIHPYDHHYFHHNNNNNNNNSTTCDIVSYIRMLSEGDYNYPISFCSSIYRLHDILHLYYLCHHIIYPIHHKDKDKDNDKVNDNDNDNNNNDKDKDKDKSIVWNHVNKMELIFNQLCCYSGKENYIEKIKQYQQSSSSSSFVCSPYISLNKHRPYSAYLSLPVCSVITINRVQDIYHNPIYHHHHHHTISSHSHHDANDDNTNNDIPSEVEFTSSSSSLSSCDIDSLLTLFHDGFILDYTQYARHAHEFNSVHIGNVWIKKIRQE